MPQDHDSPRGHPAVCQNSGHAWTAEVVISWSVPRRNAGKTPHGLSCQIGVFRGAVKGCVREGMLTWPSGGCASRTVRVPGVAQVTGSRGLIVLPWLGAVAPSGGLVVFAAGLEAAVQDAGEAAANAAQG